MAVATTLSFTSPMFAVVLSAVLLREHVGRWRWLAATLGFAGVALVADPFHLTVPVFGALVAIGGAFNSRIIVPGQRMREGRGRRARDGQQKFKRGVKSRVARRRKRL